MERLGKFLFRWLEPLSRNVFLVAIRRAFYRIMPCWMVLAVLLVLKWVMFDPWGPVMGPQGLNVGFFLTGGLYGEDYRQAEIVRSLVFLRDTVNIGIGMVTLFLSMALAAEWSRLFRSNLMMTVFAVTGMHLILLPQNLGEGTGLMGYFASRGVPFAIAVSILTSWLFARFSRVERLRVAMPELVPQRMARSLSYSLPLLLTFLTFSVFAAIFPPTLHGVAEIIKDAAEWAINEPFLPLGQRPVAAIIYQGAISFFWWLGLHGESFMEFMQIFSYDPAQAKNAIGVGEYVFTGSFFIATRLHVFALAVAMLALARNEERRKVVWFFIWPLFFNIPDPFIFALPIVFNPWLFIPFILAPIANTLVGWLAITWGIVPIFKYAVPLTMPMMFSGYLGTGSLMGVVIQLVWFVMDVAIYAPFIIASNLRLRERRGLE